MKQTLSYSLVFVAVFAVTWLAVTWFFPASWIGHNLCSMILWYGQGLSHLL